MRRSILGTWTGTALGAALPWAALLWAAVVWAGLRAVSGLPQLRVQVVQLADDLLQPSLKVRDAARRIAMRLSRPGTALGTPTAAMLGVSVRRLAPRSRMARPRVPGTTMLRAAVLRAAELLAAVRRAAKLRTVILGTARPLPVDELLVP